MEKKIIFVGIDQFMLPLARRLVEEGRLPNVRKLMEIGSASQALPEFPAWTPTNWATVATGAHAGTHGIFFWVVDMPNGVPLSSFNSYAVNAETIWEAAERAGLKLGIVHYPASMPSRLKHSYVIDGDASPGYGESRYEITPSRCYTTLKDIPNAEVIKVTEAKGWKNVPKTHSTPLEAKLIIIPKFKGAEKELKMLVLDTNGRGYDKVILSTDEDTDTMIAESRVGEWSQWTSQDFFAEGRTRRGTFRFKLIELSHDGKRIRLYRSQVMPTEGFTDPDEIGVELIEKIGPYQEHVSEFSHMSGATDYQTCIEEASYQAEWFAKAAGYLLEEKGCNLFYCHWHFLDDIMHHHLAYIDPSWEDYDPAKAEIHWPYIREAYSIADHMLGLFMKYLDGRTYLMTSSDHGNLPNNRVIHLEGFLKRKGFLAVRDESLPLSVNHPSWEKNIDFERTKVYMKRGTYQDFSLYINAEGAEFERIQDDLIKELRTWVDEETGKTPIAIALKKKDAAILGCWGQDVGDVIILLESDYTSTSLIREKEFSGEIGPVTGAIVSGHGRELLTAQTDYASHLASFIIVGPDIKKGYERNTDKLGYIELVDYVPTFCHILGIEPPAQSQGKPALDLFVGNEIIRNRKPAPEEKRELDGRIWVQKDMYDFELLKRLPWKEQLRKLSDETKGRIAARKGNRSNQE